MRVSSNSINHRRVCLPFLVGQIMKDSPALIPKTKVVATVVLHNAEMLTTRLTPESGVYQMGTIVLEQEVGQRGVTVKGIVNGLTPGKHGFSAQASGNVENGCRNGEGLYFGGLTLPVIPGLYGLYTVQFPPMPWHRIIDPF